MVDWIEEELYRRIEQTIPVAHSDIVAVYEGKVLLLRRCIPPLKGYWALPGGRIRLGETPCKAAIRELREETGLELKVLEELTTVTYFLPTRQDISITFLAQIDTDSGIILNNEHDNYMWAFKEQLPKPIHPTTVIQITKAMRR